MNTFNINQIKLEKANSIKQRNQKLRKVSNFLRVFEILLIVMVISRISIQLPLLSSLKLSHDCLHRLPFVLVSPPFVFVLGNVIVITLFVNSGQFSNNSNPCNVKNQTHKHEQHKKSTNSHNKKRRKAEESPVLAPMVVAQNQQVVKIYYRSKSEKVKREKIIDEESCRLRRSITEVKSLKSCASTTRCCKDVGEGHYPEDRMSNEEFRRTIEDFIAKQQKFLRHEEGSSAFGCDF